MFKLAEMPGVARGIKKIIKKKKIIFF